MTGRHTDGTCNTTVSRYHLEQPLTYINLMLLRCAQQSSISSSTTVTALLQEARLYLYSAEVL